MKYQPVIGLEVHAELSTKSKIYCSCSTSFGAPINTHTCPVCTGMPGALPVLNKQVVHYAAKMGLATGCTAVSYTHLLPEAMSQWNGISSAELLMQKCHQISLKLMKTS